jgi:hypothetical protein
MTASDRADRAHGGRYSISDTSVMYAWTMFSVGVGKVYVLLGLQYCDMTTSTLDRSSRAEVPQLDVTSVSTRDSTSLKTGLEEQMQDWSAASSVPHRVLIVWTAMTYERASAAHGACDAVGESSCRPSTRAPKSGFWAIRDVPAECKSQDQSRRQHRRREQHVLRKPARGGWREPGTAFCQVRRACGAQSEYRERCGRLNSAQSERPRSSLRIHDTMKEAFPDENRTPAPANRENGLLTTRKA